MFQFETIFGLRMKTYQGACSGQSPLNRLPLNLTSTYFLLRHSASVRWHQLEGGPSGGAAPVGMGHGVRDELDPPELQGGLYRAGLCVSRQ